MKESTLLILVVGMVFIVTLALPSVLTTGSEVLSGIMDFIKTGLKTVSGQQSAHLTFDIHYTDGTQRTFSPDTFSLLPLSISDGGGEVLQIDLYLAVGMTYEGTISQWSCDSLLVAHIKQGTSTKVGQFQSWVIKESGTTWTVAGQDIAKRTIMAQEIETATSAFGEGTYNLVLVFDLTMIVDFTDGTRETKGASAVPATWTYEYSTGGTEPAGAIRSLNVQIGIARLRSP